MYACSTSCSFIVFIDVLQERNVPHAVPEACYGLGQQRRGLQLDQRVTERKGAGWSDSIIAPGRAGQFKNGEAMAKLVHTVNPPTLAKPAGYSHGIECQGGKTLYVAGQVMGLYDDDQGCLME